MVHSRINFIAVFLFFSSSFFLIFFFNPWSFESFITELDFENHFTFKKLINFEKNLFFSSYYYYFETSISQLSIPNFSFSDANGRMFLSQKTDIYEYRDTFNNRNLMGPIGAVKFLYYYLIKFFIFIKIKNINQIFLYYIYFNLIIGTTFFSILCSVIYKKYSLFAALLAFLLITFCVPIYVYIRSPSIFPTIFLSLIFFYFLHNKNLEKKKDFLFYFIFGYILLSFCIFFHKSGYFIALFGSLFPIFFNLDENKIFSIKNIKIISSALVILLLAIFTNYMIENIIFGDFKYDQRGIMGVLKYYSSNYTNFLSYLEFVLGSARLLLDTFVVYLPFFHTGQNPYDLTQGKEIRILSTLNILIIIFMLRIFTKQSQILKKYFLLIIINFLAIMTHLSIFPIQTFDFHYTMYWLIFPLFFLTVVYFSIFFDSQIKKDSIKKKLNILMIVIIITGIIKIFLNNGEIKYLNIFY